MKHLLFFLSCLAFPFACHAQPGNQLVLGKKDSIQSAVLGAKRFFYVHVPTSGSAASATKKRYPVAYVFDADAQFASTVSMLQFLSTHYNSVCPEMMVVGILHENRRKELTPTHAEVIPPYWDAASTQASGGGEQFLAFIEQELMPYLDRHYPTQPYKLLMGHSLGGLAAMQTFVHHTPLFNAYVCLDPSMWWDNQALLRDAKAALETRRFAGTSLYLGIAHTVDDDLDLNTIQADTTFDTKHLRSLLQLQGYLEKNKQNGLNYQGKYYANDSHMSVPFIAAYDAFHFLFAFYPININVSEEKNPDPGYLVNKIKNHYAYASKQLGYPVHPAEELVNWNGHNALNQKQYEKAKRLFDYYLALYPTTAGAHEGLGDYYHARHETKKATAYFRQSLAIKESASVRKKLEKMQGQ
ncbi:alpha/beta hydrolase-fold protein [Hymenobacter bucti]|uniref:Alpha/beta hydrolase-fold protein n=1 Tax=Hymenobacter bucti TaxID=1844114 RepID=A0ABW4QZ98_9BACT